MFVFPPAFNHRNFRLFWTANAVSLVGSLAQDAARGWLVRSLTSDPFVVSTVAACTSFPVLLLTLYAGAVADRVDKKRGLILTNTFAAILAAVLWALTYFHLISVWQVAVLSLLAGTINAFDIPIRQSMNVEMVGREDLPNAIALNSTAFNGARVLGPAIGGQLIELVGTAGCFFVNALSFLPLVFNLGRMDLPKPEPSKRSLSFEDVREGYCFVRSHPVLWPLTLFVGVCSTFVFSYSNLLPVFAKDVFHVEERGYSALLSSAGAGSVTAAAQLALSGKMGHKGRRLFGGAFGYCVSVAAFALSPTLYPACVCLFTGGYSLLTFYPRANDGAGRTTRTGVLAVLVGTHRHGATGSAPYRQSGAAFGTPPRRRAERSPFDGMGGVDSHRQPTTAGI